MTQIFVFLYIILLGVILFIVYLVARNIEHKIKSRYAATGDLNYVYIDDIQQGYTSKEIEDFLNWQFQLGLIDSMEYNEMVMKCLPFAKQNHL